MVSLRMLLRTWSPDRFSGLKLLPVSPAAATIYMIPSSRAGLIAIGLSHKNLSEDYVRSNMRTKLKSLCQR